MSNLIKDARQPRVWYSDEHGWLIDTIFKGGLTRTEVAACVNYTKQDFARRIPRMGPGDKREQCIAALRLLDENTIKQRILAQYPWEQDRVYCSDRS